MQGSYGLEWKFKKENYRILISIHIVKSFGLTSWASRQSKTIRNRSLNKIYWVQIQGTSFIFGWVIKVFAKLWEYHTRVIEKGNYSWTIFINCCNITICSIEQALHWGLLVTNMLQWRVEKRIPKDKTRQRCKDNKTNIVRKLQKVNANIWTSPSN